MTLHKRGYARTADPSSPTINKVSVMMKLVFKTAAVSAAMLCSITVHAQQGETVKLLRIDPLTGLLGPVGVNQDKSYRFFAEKFSG